MDLILINSAREGITTRNNGGDYCAFCCGNVVITDISAQGLLAIAT